MSRHYLPSSRTRVTQRNQQTKTSSTSNFAGLATPPDSLLAYLAEREKRDEQAAIDNVEYTARKAREACEQERLREMAIQEGLPLATRIFEWTRNLRNHPDGKRVLSAFFEPKGFEKEYRILIATIGPRLWLEIREDEVFRGYAGMGGGSSCNSSREIAQKHRKEELECIWDEIESGRVWESLEKSLRKLEKNEEQKWREFSDRFLSPINK